MSYDIEVTWSGAEIDTLKTTKKIHIIYKPAAIVEAKWDKPEAAADEPRTATLTTKDLPDGTQASIEVHRFVGEIAKVSASGDLAFEKEMKILIETLKVPEGASVTLEIYRKADATTVTEDSESTGPAALA
ncbi:MAG TPA: hypothetical protein VG389_02305 [Myxococcota bacterium]|jgi:hypothetical protein|nr:hypothetical protein [Myxococcota bacterium]